VARRGWRWLRSGNDESPPVDAFTSAEDHEHEVWAAEPVTAAPVHAFAPANDPEPAEVFEEPSPEPIVPGELFGAPGRMDEDGFSEERTYAEKADAERALLATIEVRLSEARASFDTLRADALRAYADDLRARIARFEALAAEAANRAA
jgi:hypothetical protein